MRNDLIETAVEACEEGNLILAVETIETILKDNPKELKALHLKNCICKGKAELKEGAELVRSTLQKDDSQYLALLSLGKIFLTSSEYVNAAEAIKQSIKINQNYHQAWFYLAIAELKKSEPGNAIDAYRKALSIKHDFWEAYFNLGNVLKAQGELKQAITCYNRVLEIRPDSTDAHLNLGITFNQSGKHEEALESFKKAIECQPDSSEAYLHLGNTLMLAEEDQEAIEAYIKVISISPDSAIAYSNMGVALNNLLETNKAIEYFKKAIELSPNQPEAYFNLGNTLKSIGSYKEARIHLRMAIKIKTDFSAAYTTLGNTFNMLSEADSAIKYFRKAIETNQNAAEAYYCLGNRLKESGDIKEALNCFQSALKIKPNLAEAYLGKADALSDQGLSKDSQIAYATYLDYKPIENICTIDKPHADDSCTHAANMNGLKMPSDVELIPSYTSNSSIEGMHIMHLHIPKAGGTRFGLPLLECIKSYFIQNGIYKYKKLIQHLYQDNDLAFLFWDGDNVAINSKQIINSLKSKATRRIDFTFLQPHMVSHKEIHNFLIEKYGISLLRLAIYREPRQRLKSALNHLWRTSAGNTEMLIAKIKQRDGFLDNPIYRACYSDFGKVISNESALEPQVDSLIQIGDFTKLSEIQSIFLSANGLPNIITDKYIHTTNQINAPNSKSMDGLMNQCVDYGFIEHDASEHVTKLITKTIPNKYSHKSSGNEKQIHPLTFILKTHTGDNFNCNCRLIPTRYLKTSQGQDFLKAAFASPTN